MGAERRFHAYMLVGPDEPARRQAATRLAAALMCREPDAPCGRCRDCKKALAGVHPDIIYIERLPGDRGQPRRELLVEQIRQAAADAYIAPNEAEGKVYVVPEADRMNAAAQNALLKVLEEPPGQVRFVLCTTAADALLPTVRSRCVRVDTDDAPEGPAELSAAAREYITLAASGNRADMTAFCLMRAKLAREQADELCGEIYGALCDILCARRENPGLSHTALLRQLGLLSRAETYLRRNLSPKQVFGLLAAEYEV